MRLRTTAAALLLAAAIAAAVVVVARTQCGNPTARSRPSPDEEVAALRRRVESVEAALATRDRSDRMAVSRADAPWVASGDGEIAVRLWADSVGYTPSTTSIFLGMEVKNTSDGPLVVRSPEIMWHTALFKIVGPKGALNYTGPQISRPPSPPVTVAPGRSVQGGVELDAGQFPGLNQQGQYRLTYDYSSGGPDVSWAGTVRVGIDFDVR